MKGENSDVPKFQYKVTVLFHQKLKMFTENCYIILSFYTHTHTQYIYIYMYWKKYRNIYLFLQIYMYIKCILCIYNRMYVFDICKETEEGICRNILNVGLL